VNGKEQIIFIAKEGDCLGEMAVLGNIPRTASLRARGNVQLLVIEGGHFLSLLHQHPDMAIQVIKLLVERIAQP
jgi:CRP-like cAMP-binding protein